MRVASWLIGSHLFAVTSYCRKRSRGPFFVSDMNLIVRAVHSPFPDHLPQALYSNTITPRVRFEHRNRKRDLTFKTKQLAAEHTEGAGGGQREEEGWKMVPIVRCVNTVSRARLGKKGWVRGF